MNYLLKYIKHNRWYLVLSFVLTFVALPVSLWLKIDSLKNRTIRMPLENDLHGEDIISVLIRHHVNQNTVFLFSVILLAIASAYVGFSYLHSQQPNNRNWQNTVSKSTVYYVTLVGNLIVYAVPILVNILLSMVVAAGYGYFAPRLLGSYVLIALTYSLYYLLVYHLVAIAILLTGTFAMSVLYFLILCYMEYYVSLTSFYRFIQENHLQGTLIISTIIVMLGFATYFLLLKRPDQLEGKAFAFPFAQKVSKYVLVIFLSIYVGTIVAVLLGVVSVTMTMLVIAVSCIVWNLILDIGFHMTWKEAVENWKEILYTMVLSLLIALILGR